MRWWEGLAHGRRSLAAWAMFVAICYANVEARAQDTPPAEAAEQPATAAEQPATEEAAAETDLGVGTESRVTGGKQRLESNVQGLLDRFKKDAKVLRASGALPVTVAFPRLGKTLYLTAQLTPEGEAPRIALNFERQRTK